MTHKERGMKHKRGKMIFAIAPTPKIIAPYNTYPTTKSNFFVLRALLLASATLYSKGAPLEPNPESLFMMSTSKSVFLIIPQKAMFVNRLGGICQKYPSTVPLKTDFHIDLLLTFSL
jgi:hypothetical protein